MSSGSDIALRVRLAAERVRRERSEPSLRDTGPTVRGYKAAALLLGIAPRTLHLWVAANYDGIADIITRRTPRQAIFDRARLQAWNDAHSIGADPDAPRSDFRRETIEMPGRRARRPGATREIVNLIGQAQRPMTLLQLQLSLELQFEAAELSAAVLRLYRRHVLARELVASESTSGRRHVWGYVRGPSYDTVRGLCESSHARSRLVRGP